LFRGSVKWPYCAGAGYGLRQRMSLILLIVLELFVAGKL